MQERPRLRAFEEAFGDPGLDRFVKKACQWWAPLRATPLLGEGHLKGRTAGVAFTPETV
jgi:hypothetical protein